MADLIALFGPQQVGKSTTAQSLVEACGYTKLSFADPLYSMIATLMGVGSEDIRMMDKEAPMEALEGKSIRFALQSLGTEWGRDMIGDQIWRNNCLRRAQEALNDGELVVIDDCRFLNEYDGLKEMGAKFVRLVREDMPAQSNPKHGSELDWQKFEADATVVNPSEGVVNWMQLAGKAVLAALDARV